MQDSTLIAECTAHWNAMHVLPNKLAAVNAVEVIEHYGS